MVRILNDEDRIFEAWGSVEIRDIEGDLLPMEEFEPIMPILMKRGGFIIDDHSNRVVGKILNYQFKGKEIDGKVVPGLLLTNQIFKDYKTDDEVWGDIVNGGAKGMSFGGRSRAPIERKVIDGQPTNIRRQLEGFEFTVVRGDKIPVNPEAEITYANTMAKSTKCRYVKFGDVHVCIPCNKEQNVLYDIDFKKGAQLLNKKVEKRGNKWCVVHCHGPDAGKPIKCFDTKEEADRMHRAIQANKSKEMKKMPEDKRPPKSWWDNCIGTARGIKGMEDPEAFCGWMWHHGKGAGFGPQREAIGKSFDSIFDKAIEFYKSNIKLKLDKELNNNMADGQIKKNNEESTIMKALDELKKLVEANTEKISALTKQDEEEDKKKKEEEDKKKKEEDKETNKAEGAPEGTDSAEGGEGAKKKLPEDIAEKVHEEQPGDSAPEKVKLEKGQMEEIVKNVIKALEITKSTTGRPGIISDKHEKKDDPNENLALEIAKGKHPVGTGYQYQEGMDEEERKKILKAIKGDKK